MIRKINVVLLTLSMLLAVSCSEDYLDTAPTNAISAEDALSSPENMMLVLNGLHRMMYAQNPLTGATWSRTGQSHFLPMYDAIGGSIIHTARANGWMRSDLQWLMHTDATFTTTLNVWYQLYHFIASANSIINKVEEDGLTKDELMNNILGQAHAYRAWAYHVLVTTYAKGYLVGNPASDPGVPLIFSTEAPYESGPRATVAEIYAQVESDINQAIAYLNDASSAKNKSHISINAAYGIKARVALQKGDWATAASSAAAAREGYSLLDESGWLSGFNTYDLSEVIWGGRVIDEETNYFASYFYYICSTFNGSQNRGNPKIIDSTLYNMIPATDYRAKAWLPWAPNTNPAASNGQGGFGNDPNYDDEAEFKAAKQLIVDTYGVTPAHNTHPYMNVKFLQKNPGTINTDDVIYIRSSEMYLIEAEAKAMLNDVSGAQAALNVLGKARDTAFDAAMYTSKETLMEQIKFQRKVELWGEGFSYHDKIRWNDVHDMSTSGAAEVLYQDGFKQGRPSENARWIFKIPQREIDANPNLTEENQNKY